MSDLFYGRAPRLTFFDLSRPGEEDSEMSAQFNPSEFSGKVEANYAQLAPLGQPHQILQYQGTTNHTFSMSLFWLVQDEPTRTQIQKARRFIEAMFYPDGSAQTVVGGSPPDILVVWPGTVSMVVRFRSMSTQFQRFNREGEVIQWTVAIAMEERRTSRLTKQDVLKYGTLRPQGT